MAFTTHSRVERIRDSAGSIFSLVIVCVGEKTVGSASCKLFNSSLRAPISAVIPIEGNSSTSIRPRVLPILYEEDSQADALLCPVFCMKRYLQVTDAFRGPPQKRLFIPWKSGIS